MSLAVLWPNSAEVYSSQRDKVGKVGAEKEALGCCLLLADHVSGEDERGANIFVPFMQVSASGWSCWHALILIVLGRTPTNVSGSVVPIRLARQAIAPSQAHDAQLSRCLASPLQSSSVANFCSKCSLPPCRVRSCASMPSPVCWRSLHLCSSNPTPSQRLQCVVSVSGSGYWTLRLTRSS